MNTNDEAVSPVIGVILMVAITVILAAVIAAFVFGMAGNIQKSKIVAASAQQVGDNVIITYQGGMDSNDVETLAASVTFGSGAAQTVTYGDGWDDTPPAVGSTATAPGSIGQDHVVVTAAFKDGQTSVILDTNV